MTAPPATRGGLAPAVTPCQNVTGSAEAGRVHGDDVPELPRPNDELEQCCGALRYHERRTTGRKGAGPGLVVRGAVRVVAALATRERPFAAAALPPADLTAWHTLREQLTHRQAARCARLRCREDPAA